MNVYSRGMGGLGLPGDLSSVSRFVKATFTKMNAASGDSLIEKMYGHHYTPQTMSNMTKVLTEEVNAFKSRALNDKYVAIFGVIIIVRMKTVKLLL
ncbi:hypothetical protein EfmJHP35_03150 [Enterococcus faecium]|nr:hypothetical protein EfmJHP35_03150 [Enterococcus faecium]